MNETSPDDDPEKSLKWFPGTAEQEQRFRRWIEETDQPLLFPNVSDWLWENAATIFDDLDEEDAVQDILNNMAKDFQRKISPTATIMLPGYGYPLDIIPHGTFPFLEPYNRVGWAATPLLVRELCMLKVVEEITNKPAWWANVHDTHITDKWKKEILGLEWSNYMEYADFTPSMADWCIEELRLKSDLYQKIGLIPVLDHAACVIKSDKLVPEALNHELSLGSKKLLRTTSNGKKSRGGLVFDLIDPSICPLIYNHSRILPDRHIDLTDCLEACGRGDTLASLWDPNNDTSSADFDTSFQWLPCNVIMDDTGNVKINSYINNLHPIEHADLYTTIEKFITLALPALDVVYRWHKEFSHQRIGIEDIRYDCKTPNICADAEEGCSWFNMPLSECDEVYQAALDRRRDPIFKWFNETHPLQFPELRSTSFDKHVRLSSSDVRSSDFFLRKNKHLQFIVQLTEIHLTPENPEYKGDLWDVDGWRNEHIVSTAFFCYDSDNVTDCHIYFDTAILPGDIYSVPDPDSDDLLRAFNLPPRAGSQVLGRVLASPGRAVFYPNVYRHRQGSFSLANRSRPGYYKVLKLCLVDPAMSIISTSNVPPQQFHWWTECKVHCEGVRLAQRLPPELQNIVLDYVDMPIDRKGAEDIRRELLCGRLAAGIRTPIGGDEKKSGSDESNNE
ncbi:hypothetical protein J3E69DRAFT_381039 [Trichoderma sp. SZMC 28015]